MSKSNTAQKLTALILFLIMIVSTAPVFAAEETGADYSWYDSNPGAAAFEIGSAAQLQGLADIVNGNHGYAINFWNKKITLTADLDLSDYENWTPIGNSKETPFLGTFEGGKHTISNLTIDAPEAEYIGLFGMVRGTVKDVILTDVDITGKKNVGGIAGEVWGVLNHCAVVGGQVAGYENVGGVVGLAAYDPATIKYLSTVPSVESRIERCFATCNVFGTGESPFRVGGVAGCAEFGNILNCYATGSVSDAEIYPHVLVDKFGPAGGVVGRAYSSSIVGCYATGDVVGYWYIGGIVGSADASMDRWSRTENCLALNGLVSASFTFDVPWTGRVAGYNVRTNSSNTFALSTMNLVGRGGANGTNITPEELQTQEKFISNGFPTPTWTGGVGKLAVLADFPEGLQSADIPWRMISGAPSMPVNITAVQGDQKVTVNWAAPAHEGSSAIIRYEVCKDSEAWISAGMSTSYTFTGLINDTEYTFKVRAVNSNGDGREATIKKTPGTPPGAVQNPIVVYEGNTLTLFWEKPAGTQEGTVSYETRYCAATSMNDHASWTFAAVGDYSYSYTNGSSSVDFTIQIRPLNIHGYGPVTEISGSRNLYPTPPRTVTATSENGKVTLKWSAPEYKGSGNITAYQVFHPVSKTWVSAGMATSYTVTGLTNGVSYRFFVRAVNGSGNGTSATLVTMSLNPPAITSGNSCSLTYGAGGSFQVQVTGTAPLTFSLTGAPAGVTVDNAGLISISKTISAGSYPFTVKVSNGALPDATQAFTLTIGKANNTLSISCANITYGATPAPSVGTNVSGGAVTYTYKVQGAADSTYTATVPTGVGSYTVRGTSAATANYNAATATANFTIGKANNTLSISCADITYGATPAPSVETNVSGGAVTYTYKVQGAADSTYTATVPTGAGSYTVRGTSAATANYNAATATANFSIIKSAGISPAGGTFDRNPSYQADVTTTITWNSAAAVKGVKADGVTIDAGSYSVVGDTLTVKKEYLATKPMGNLILSIEFDKGESATFTIAISDTTPYSVTYDANGGSGTAPTEDNKVAGSTFKAANNTLTPPASKKFKEWNTAANGSGTAYAPDATVTMPAQNFTLYAIWRDFTPAERIEADFDALLWNTIKGSNSAENDVKTALNLPKTGANGTTITWSASPTGIINTGTGAVTRQLDDDKTVALTATVSYTGATAKTKTFNLNVPATPGKFEAEDAVINKVKIYGDTQAVGASGGKQVGSITTKGSSYVQWGNLPKSLMVEIRYASINNGTISIYRNGEHIMDAAFTSTGGWYGVGCFRSIWLPLEINSGDSLKVQYDDGDAVLNVDYIECYSSIIGSASISLDSGTFDRNPAKQADAVASIIWNSAKTITDVKAGGVSIGPESYSVVGNKLTIKKEYLASQPFGDLALTVVFDKGDPTAFTIITIPGNAVINPAGVTFDRNPTDAEWTDVTATITWNDANAVTDVKLNGVSVGTDAYALSGDTLTIKGNRLIYQPFGNLTATIVFDRGDPATLEIAVVPMNSHVFPKSNDFKKDAPADVTTYVTFNDAVSVTDITAGGVSIGAGNYSVSGYVLTIKKEYLAEQDEGELILTVVFDKGASDTLTITIADNPSVSPTTGTYDRTPGKKADVTATIGWGGATSVTGVSVLREIDWMPVWVTLDPENYDVAGNTLTIKKEFLATLLPVGDFEFSVYFDIGEPATLTVTILPGNASISPNSGTFDKNPAEQENVTATITENDSKGVKYVKAGDTDLEWGSDIDMKASSTIGEGMLIIKKEYLASQPVGELVLNVGFWAGDPVTLTINIIDTTPEISAAIPGVTAPVCGATPVTAIIETAQYSGTVTWDPAHNPFAPSTVYTATITLTPKAGYSLSGITENFFTVDGAIATNAANSGVVTATFPATGAEPAVTYSVTYNANGGEGAAPTESDKAASATFAAANNTLTPPTGKKFKHWYTNPLDTGGTPYAQGATVTMPANDLILYAIWEDESPDMKRGYLEVKTLEGGEVKLNGSSTPLSPVYSTPYEMGTSIRLEAVASSGYTFAYWLNVKNSSIISDDPVYEVIMGSGVNVTAVFAKVPAAEDTWYTVTFKDKGGKILQLTNVAKNGSVTPPAEPPLFGYSFSHWSHSSSNVTSDRIITAIYVRETDTYTVTVEGGTLSTGGNEGSYRFDMPVTVTAGAAPDGQKFSHWEQDGKKVSTKSAFTFFAPMRDTSLVAVFVDNSTVIENKPFITLSNDVMVNSTNGTILFTAIKDLRAGYTLVESGVLLLKSPTSDLTVDTPNIILGNILDTSTDQFYIMKSNVEVGDTWYGRAYLIYKDREGNMVTVYSDNIEPGTR